MAQPLQAAPARPRRVPVLRWLGTLVSGGLLVWLVAREWASILAAVKQLEWYYLLAVVLLTCLSRVNVWLRWHVLLRSGGVAIPAGQSLRLVLAGLFASNFLPTTIGGDVVRLAGAVRLKFSAAVCAASLVVDRLVGMAGMATVLPIGLARFFALPLPVLPASRLPSAGLAAGGTGSLLTRLAHKARQALASVWQAVRLWISHPRGLLLAYLATWGHMLCVFATVWLLFRHLGNPVPFWMVAGLWSMSYFFTLLPISINGLGLQELSLTFLYVNYGGAALENAAVVALLMRVLQVLVSLPGALFVPGLIDPGAAQAAVEEKA